FDFVAVGIVNPGEAAITFVLALGVDLDASFSEAVEQRVYVIDDVIDHERRWARLEIFGVARENAPDGHLLFVGIVVFLPRQDDAMAAIRQAKIFCVPFLHPLRIVGLEKDAADAEDAAFLSLLLTHCSLPFCELCRAMLLRHGDCWLRLWLFP